MPHEEFWIDGDLRWMNLSLSKVGLKSSDDRLHGAIDCQDDRNSARDVLRDAEGFVEAVHVGV